MLATADHPDLCNRMRKFSLFFGILSCLFSCRTGQLRERNIPKCLQRTDFTGHNPQLRADIAWLIEYGYKVQDSRCCALQPRTDILAMRSDLPELQSELLNRVAAIEKNNRSEERSADTCYRALMDIWYEAAFTERQKGRKPAKIDRGA